MLSPPTRLAAVAAASSISARSAIAGPPGLDPASVPITPVRATPRIDGDAEGFEQPRGEFGGTVLREGGFGMAVEFVPPACHPRLESRRCD